MEELTEKEVYALEIFNRTVDKIKATSQVKISLVNAFVETIKESRQSTGILVDAGGNDMDERRR